MSQPSNPWTDAESDPFPLSPAQEIYTQAQIEEAFAQHSSDQPGFSSIFDDGLHAPSFTYDSTSSLNTDSPYASNASTPFSGYSFGQQSPAYSLSGASTPYLYPLEQQQAYEVDHQYAAQNRPVPLRAHTNSSFDPPAQPPHASNRRRSLSHGDLDRITTAPSHPTFVRLQGFQDPRTISAASDDERRLGFLGHSRSRSVRGRPFQNPVPITMLGTHIGTSLNEPKDKKVGKKGKRTYKANDDGETSPKFADPLIRKMTDPAQLAQSRRIIEIGVMAVRNHGRIDPALESSDNMSPHEHILEKLEDVERYLHQDSAKNAEALKGCAMIRAALHQRARSIDAAANMEGDIGVDQDALEAPSKVMGEDDLGLFGGVLDDNELMSLLTRDNEQTGGEEEDM